MQYNGDRDLKDVASNPLTPPYVLADLRHNRDLEIRRLVASNPNTPIGALMQLGKQFPDIIIENPVFKTLKIEEPNSKFVRLSLARSSKTDPDTLAKLAATEEDEAVLYAIARNINTPIDTVKSLIAWRHPDDDSTYPDIEVTRNALNNPNLTIHYLEQLLESWINVYWNELMVEFCKLPNVSVKMVETLAGSYAGASFAIDVPLAQNSPEILDQIARYSFDNSVLIKIIENPIAWESTIEYLAASPEPEVRNAITERSNVSTKILDILLFMQGKPGTPIELLNELAEDIRFNVLRLLTKYPETPSEVLHKIASAGHYDGLSKRYEYSLDYWDIFENIAIHPNTSLKTLNLLTNDRNWHERDLVIRTMIKDKLEGKSLSPEQMLKLRLEAGNVQYNRYHLQDRYSEENLYEPDAEIPF